MENNFENRVDLSGLTGKMQGAKAEISKHIIGQNQMIDLLLIALLADGHTLIEGVPGVAKTLTAKLLAKTIDAEFKRIQFTPDLMPSDIIGTSIFNAKNASFEFKKGPLFANIVLTDEINRAPAKTQAALFEAMEERQISVDGTTYKLDEPFMVLATQNPIEQEGTYRLPEAQLDRFLFKIHVHYPALEDENTMLSNFHTNKSMIDPALVKAVIGKKEVLELRKTVSKI
ncbi:MAG TPA: AAA family ATPase, partial [Bacteroidia bacterium]|nr:AAA family ATPase [Bacteroidia bacterium]